MSLQSTVNYVQAQTMRNNLVFSGIEEDADEKPEQTEAILRTFLTKEMKLAQDLVDSLKFERVHRMGERSFNHPGVRVQRFRNIVAKFTYFKDREMIRRASPALKKTRYYINEQFPKEVADRRKALLPKLREARAADKKAWFSYDKLFIDGKQVRLTEPVQSGTGSTCTDNSSAY